MQLPPSFLNLLPTTTYIDGEVWFGRGQYTESQKLINSLNVDNWQNFRVVGFDNPNPFLNNTEFEKRFETLLQTIDRHHPFIKTSYRLMCDSPKKIRVILKKIVENNGEGIVLRKPNSLYFHGRSPALVKLKATQADREGIIVAVSADSVSLKIPEGYILQVPARDIHLSPPSSPSSSSSHSSRSSFSSTISPEELLKKGDIVSFSYESTSRHRRPVNPKITRLRHDILWSHVLSSFASEQSLYASQEENGGKKEESEKEGFTTQRHGFWKAEGRKNMRDFLEKFMRERKGRDPLVADHWYLISRKDLSEMEGGEAIGAHLKGGFVNTLKSLFPELNLDPSKFHRLSNFWHDLKNRRRWFIELAKTCGFDPLSVDHWYNVTIPDISDVKGSTSLLKCYAGSMIKALQHLFPEITFNPGKFKGSGKTYWQEPINQRRFFLSFAKANHFDPLQPKNWYTFASKLSKVKGINSLLHYYGGSLSKALLQMFPKIGLKDILFSQPPSFWKDEKKRKQFFDVFARDHAFEPLVPENWYSREDELLAHKGISSLLEYHNNSVATALQDLYQPIHFDLTKFPNYNKEFWHDVKNREEFFETFAKKMNFDPLIQSNWHSISKKLIRAEKGGNMILYLYNNSMTKAINDTFPELKLKKLVPKTKNFWDDPGHRREFFVSFAKEHNFDPLIAQNWYNLNRNLIIQTKGGSRVLFYSNNSLHAAIKELFPVVALDYSLFSHKPRFYWNNIANRKQFFEHFAEKHSFDPLIPDNWCKLTKDQIIALKGEAIVSYYGGSIRKTLNDIFPQLTIAPTKMPF